MIRTSRSSFPVAVLTHPGMTGKNNEDRYAISAYRLNKRSRAPVLLAVLADGIGGHRAGEIAAEIAVERISQAVAGSDGGQPVVTLRNAILQASQDIFNLARNDPGRQGMGTTCVCAWIIDRRLYTASIGDSRLYLIRRGHIYQLNTDHTWIQEALETGVLKPNQVKGHPNQHVIRRYIGSPNPPEVDFRLRSPYGGIAERSEINQGFPLQERDRLLLCSDGLTDLVEDKEILAACQRGNLAEANQALVDLANKRGGHDNITVVCIEIPRHSLIERMATSKRLMTAASVGAVILGVVIFAGLLTGFDWLNYRGDGGSTEVADTPQPTQGLPVLLPSPTLTQGVTPFLPALPTLYPTSTVTPQASPTLAIQSGNTPTPWPTNTVGP